MIIGIHGKIGSGKDTVARMIQELQILSIGYKSIEGKTDSEINALSQWKTKRFADKLKDMVCLMIGCTREQLEDREFKEKPLGEEWDCWEYKTSNSAPLRLTMDEETARMEGSWNWGKRQMTPRLMMQLIGTECGREIIHPNIWVNALFADYRCGGWDDGYKWKSCACEKDECDYSNEYTPKWIIPDTRFPNEAQAIRDRGGVLIKINRLNPDDVCKSCGEKRSEHHYRHPFMLDKKFNHASETALDEWKDWDYIIDNDSSINDLLTKVKEIYNELG